MHERRKEIKTKSQSLNIKIKFNASVYPERNTKQSCITAFYLQIEKKKNLLWEVIPEVKFITLQIIRCNLLKTTYVSTSPLLLLTGFASSLTFVGTCLSKFNNIEPTNDYKNPAACNSLNNSIYRSRQKVVNKWSISTLGALKG